MKANIDLSFRCGLGEAWLNVIDWGCFSCVLDATLKPCFYYFSVSNKYGIGCISFYAWCCDRLICSRQFVSCWTCSTMYHEWFAGDIIAVIYSDKSRLALWLKHGSYIQVSISSAWSGSICNQFILIKLNMLHYHCLLHSLSKLVRLH